jgi:hypothetical protein
MATANRAALINRMFKVLKKHYQGVATPERSALEHLLYACCLENSAYEAADKAYAAVSTTFFDWNEVRVSTVKELAEVMHMLAEPSAAGARLKRVLQSVFESGYTFDIESIKKLTLGQAQQKLQKYEGVTPFAVAYMTQATLGGHAIPLDRGLLDAFGILGLATEQEKAAHNIPGLERAIPKNKGIEFGSLAHQLGADLVHSPHSPNLHKVFLEIAPDCKERLPKRGAKPAKPAEPAMPTHDKEKPAAAEPSKSGKAAEPASESKSGKSKAPIADKKPAAKAPPAKHAAADKHSHEKPAPHKAAAHKPAPEKKKSAAAGLAKRKPR